MSDRAVVIAGASSGIGAAIARQAAAAGWGVVVGFDRGADRAAEIVREIAAAGGRAKALRIGLDRPDEIAQALDGATDVGDIAALALSAAPPLALASFLKTTAADFRAQFDVQAIGNHALIVAAWKKWFRPRGGGHVVGILSASVGPPAASHMTAYVAAKLALDGVLRGALAELGPGGLSITEIVPGAVDTPMLASLGERVRASFAKASPGGQLLSPEAVARAVVDALDAPPAAGKMLHRSVGGE